MTLEHTLSIIKPGAVRRNIIGQIISRFESSGLRIAAARMVRLSQEQAEQFYAVHRERPFYSELVAYMTEGPILVMVLEGEDATGRRGRYRPKPGDYGLHRSPKSYARHDSLRPGQKHHPQHRTRLRCAGNG